MHFLADLESCRPAPTFSVVIPTFRRPAFALRAVESVMAQHYPALEVIVVDDGSGISWDYSSVEAKLGMKIVRNNANAGVASARNCGIRLAKGEYVCFLDDDDEFDRDFLKCMARTIQQLSIEPDFVWCGVRFVHYAGDVAVGVGAARCFPESYPSLEALHGYALSIGTGFGLTAKRDLLLQIGLFDENLRVTEDTDLVIRLIRAGAVAHALPEILVNVHNHAAERLTGVKLHALRIQECALLLEKYSAFFARHMDYRLQLQHHVKQLGEELSLFARHAVES
jgi:glycosyltransferase involved in cell wall biosynthesis